ncbi:esterase/lipase family protein [Nocardia huaxiensis]|uniref:Lipase n=1 Tax=Nocardia huaxiensis TaxID=2755382 RepID=A0A7D6VJE1_9NOCA|nr:alpha/beta fold hydrolase [Nocardia huaxiensis]QLY30850.1 lipase [Nocardia huaxiensis]UFS94355.1 lipase [Nocardia huaxiensis]
MLLRRIKTLLLAGLSGALAVTVAVPGTAAADGLPVVYGMGPFVNAILTATAPYDPPGGNDWTCRPGPERPLPVVLVTGLSGNGENSWQTISPLLKNEGYCVFALTYGTYPGDSGWWAGVGGRTPIMDSSAELARYVDQVLAVTGAPKVKLLTWSAGAVVGAAYIQFLGGDRTVDAQVSLAPMWKGTQVAQSTTNSANSLGIYNSVYAAMNPPCGACVDVLTGSAFIDRLTASGVYSDEVRYYSVLTEVDGQVVPFTNGWVDAPNATNVVLQHGCPQNLTGHLMLSSDPRSVNLAVQGLDPDQPRSIPCAPNSGPAGI